MGLLSLGTPLEWDKGKDLSEYVREHGITQLLHLYDLTKDRTGDVLLWGDEIEYMVVSLDHERRSARLSLRQEEILGRLMGDEGHLVENAQEDGEGQVCAGDNDVAEASVRAIENGGPHTLRDAIEQSGGAAKGDTTSRRSSSSNGETAFGHGARTRAMTATHVAPTFHPEYGRYMLESTPGAPYAGSLKDLLSVEANMRLRRQTARSKMDENEIPVTLTSFPRLGAPGVFLDPHHEPNGATSRSLFLPDQVTNTHPRFPTLTANIRRRRGNKVAINVPIFRDVHTPWPFVDPTVPTHRGLFPEDDETSPDPPAALAETLPDYHPTGVALPNHIYMDAMGFGMGCCCLQITFQACSVLEARQVYDALIPLAPIMLAVTAAAPMYRGYLADVDCRWDVIAGSVDDRTPAERGFGPEAATTPRRPKSRYDSVDLYIADDPENRPEYNDIECPINEGVKARLMKHGLDEHLAKHFGHLFIRDPLVVFTELIEQNDEESTNHFENIQSTNWQTLRFKPPPPDSPIGWRVEFRSMEVQITDYENAAFSLFIVLLTRAILSFGLNFYLPLSKVDQNMKTAQKRNAVLEDKFFFRKDVFAKGRRRVRSGMPGSNDRSLSRDPHAAASPAQSPIEEEYAEMSINEIVNGPAPGGDESGGSFPGLIPLIESYLDSVNCDIETRCELSKYLELIKRRSSGQLMTTAQYLRKLVQENPQYKKDSVISQEVCYDLVKTVDEIERGEIAAPMLLGGWKGRTS